MNVLGQETSPYLLQHASNPVNWQPWNDAALATAKTKNKLIIISIGYSACHWCHVMEHESFENQEVAQLMNRYFVNIKIDREERPDVDAVYMKAIQLMTGRGGWPLNVVAMPDGRPVWGGTYFRKEEWMETLAQLQQIYLDSPEKMLDYAKKLEQGMQQTSLIDNPNAKKSIDLKQLDVWVDQWKDYFDWDFGGMASAPKFMMPNNYQFLLRWAHQKKDAKLLDFVNLTLTKMAQGGIFDAVDGGFSRYAVDRKWHVPHFEKMLYDNGQLVSLYADAYKLTKKESYKNVIEKTLQFVDRVLTQQLTNQKARAFYSALDADSINANGHLEEGAFYVWTKPDLQRLIAADFELFAQVFNINSFGFWEQGNYVLIQNQSLEEIALQNHIEPRILEQKKQQWEQILFLEREKRDKPRLDDKSLTSWNAIMLKGYVDAYKALQNQHYLDVALQNAQFIIQNQWAADGFLYHSFKNGTSSINGFLEDYCFVIQAFIALYEVTFDEDWLQNAKKITEYSLVHFYDAASGLFRFTSVLDAPLITTHFETEDNVIAASNSVMAKNLHRLSIYFSDSNYEAIAQKMLAQVVPAINYPSAFSNWLDVTLDFETTHSELAICGSFALPFAQKINSQYVPHLLLAGTTEASTLPFLKNRFVAEQTVFYSCKNQVCQLQKTDFQEILNELISK